MELPDIGLLTIEDSETGEQIELDTGRAEIRMALRCWLRKTARSSDDRSDHRE